MVNTAPPDSRTATLSAAVLAKAEGVD